jgi:hypothetical protein
VLTQQLRELAAERPDRAGEVFGCGRAQVMVQVPQPAAGDCVMDERFAGIQRC